MVRLLLWTVLAIFMIGIYLFLDYQLGKRRHKKDYIKFEFPLRKSNVQIFASGSELFEEFFSDLKKATHHIHSLFYIVRNDDFSHSFLSILKERANEGVQVRLLLDWVGSLKLPKKEVNKLRDAGVQIEFCHVPKPPYFFYSLQARNHRKITVIDGKVGYLGGFNVGKEYINLDPKLTPWRDYHIKLTGEGVQDLQKQFLLDWFDSTGEHLTDDHTYYPPLNKGNVIHRIVATEGVELEQEFVKLISYAKKSIRIGTPYFIPSKRLFQSIIHAIDRGIEVTILVPKISDHMLVKEASYPYFRKLLKKGCKIYQYLNGFYHGKVLMIDEEIVDIGTANMDKRSLYLNCEVNCIFYSHEVLKNMKEIYEKDLSNSHLLTLDELNHPNVKRTLLEWIAFVLSPLL